MSVTMTHGERAERQKIWAQPGIEPGTSPIFSVTLGYNPKGESYY